MRLAILLLTLAGCQPMALEVSDSSERPSNCDGGSDMRLGYCPGALNVYLCSPKAGAPADACGINNIAICFTAADSKPVLGCFVYSPVLLCVSSCSIDGRIECAGGPK